MSSDEETAMIRETVAKFVDRELIPLEPHYLKSRLPGSDHPELTVEQKQRLRTVSKDLGLWGLDVPEDLGGQTCRPAPWPRSTRSSAGPACRSSSRRTRPNLHMLLAVGTEAQERKYLEPYIEGRMSLGDRDLRARRRRRSRRHEDPRGEGWRPLGDQRPQDLDQPRRRRPISSSSWRATGERQARTAASPPSSSTRAPRASSSSARSRCWAASAPTSWCSRIAACPRARCWARSARALRRCSCA